MLGLGGFSPVVSDLECHGTLELGGGLGVRGNDPPHPLPGAFCHSSRASPARPRHRSHSHSRASRQLYMDPGPPAQRVYSHAPPAHPRGPQSSSRLGVLHEDQQASPPCTPAQPMPAPVHTSAAAPVHAPAAPPVHAPAAAPVPSPAAAPVHAPAAAPVPPPAAAPVHTPAAAPVHAPAAPPVHPPAAAPVPPPAAAPVHTPVAAPVLPPAAGPVHVAVPEALPVSPPAASPGLEAWQEPFQNLAQQVQQSLQTMQQMMQQMQQQQSQTLQVVQAKVCGEVPSAPPPPLLQALTRQAVTLGRSEGVLVGRLSIDSCVPSLSTYLTAAGSLLMHSRWLGVSLQVHKPRWWAGCVQRMVSETRDLVRFSQSDYMTWKL